MPKLEESVSSEEDNGSSSDHKLYVPPKVVSAPYEESSRKSRAKRGQGAALVKELKEEVLDTPTELKVSHKSVIIQSIFGFYHYCIHSCFLAILKCLMMYITPTFVLTL